MSAPLRFLALTVLAWAGVRAATLGTLPGAAVFRIEPSEAKTAPPALVTTEFPPIEPLPAADDTLVPVAAAYPAAYAPPPQPYYPPARPNAPPEPRPTPISSAPGRVTLALPEPRPAFYSPIPPLDEWPLSRIAAVSMPVNRSSVVAPAQSVPVIASGRGLDRLQLTAWALLRGTRTLVSGPSTIATGGTLGGSQAGARLTYNIHRQVAATLRTSSDVGRRDGEVAAGVRVQPLPGLPVWVNAERRQRLGKLGGGRNAFAVFLEGGVYDRPLPWRFSLDAYAQAGIVGFHHRDRFVDGALTVTRPIYRNISAGLGLWGGAQPGLYRVDAGPRISLRVRNNMRIHLDYRQRLAGNAEPGSGPTLTLAGDF